MTFFTLCLLSLLCVLCSRAHVYWNVSFHEALHTFGQAMRETRTPNCSFPAVIIGDSTMMMLWQAFEQEFHTTLTKQYITSGRCHLNDFFNLSYPERWVNPEEGEGPLVYGRRKRNCQDCNGCVSALAVKDPSIQSSLDFLGIEFMSDVEIQSREYRTTQENLVYKYLLPTYANASSLVIIVAGGLHDAIHQDPLLHYEKNLNTFLALFRGALPKAQIIWLSLAATQSIPPQTNEMILALNHIFRNLTRHYNVPYLDIEAASFHFRWLLRDNLHHLPMYYQMLKRLVLQFLERLRGPLKPSS